MKRSGNIYQEVYSIENLVLADMNASRGKMHQPGVMEHNKNAPENLVLLQEMLQDKTYKTSPYTTFKVFEPKEREVYRLPYFPDRIAHWALMNVLEKKFVATFTADTYSCIKKKGIHGAARALKKSLKDVPGTMYCLKLDVKKFYPNIDHAVLKNLLRKKFKDPDLLWLLDEIIDSAPGLPIGNYLSQYLANFYLTYFDHWIKEKMGVKHYFRYADDIVVLSGSKGYLHTLLAEIREYFGVELKLTIKDNYQVFPVAARGIDFVGYVFFHTHVLLRKSIKKNFARKVARGISLQSLASYHSWTKHADCINLNNKLLKAA